MELLEGYAFRVRFDDEDIEPLHTDELRPLGAGSGPSPSRLLAAAITNCLAASLTHCLRRSRVGIRGLAAKATVAVGRNDRGRLRIQRVAVVLSPDIDAAHAAQLERCAEVFQDYCTVTASLREGFEIDVDVAGAPGAGP
jgi:uncharacterized OsmC-like protein